MNIEDRMSMWAAKRPRDEVSELLLEGAQEIADLRRQREEDGKQMTALISGYQTMRGLCIDGKYLTDDERWAVVYYIGTGGPESVDATLGGLLERMRSGALTETVSQDGDYPDADNATNHDAAPAATAQPNTAGRDSDFVAGTGDTLTEEEREAVQVASAAFLRERKRQIGGGCEVGDD